MTKLLLRKLSAAEQLQLRRFTRNRLNEIARERRREHEYQLIKKGARNVT